MEALTRSSRMIIFGKTLSPPRTLLGRSGFHFLRSPSSSSNNVRFVHSISLQNKGIQLIPDSPSPLPYQTEVWTGLEGAANGIQASQHWKTVHVKFQLQKECSYGEKFLIVGDDTMIGSWDPSRALPLNWSDGHVWTLELDIPVDLPIQFKFILQRSEEEMLWQPGPDRVLRTWDTKNTIVVAEDWEDAEIQKISEEEQMVNQNDQDQVLNMGSEPIVVPIVNEELMFANNLTAAYAEDKASDHNRKSEFISSPEEERIGKNSNGAGLAGQKAVTASMETKETMSADHEKGGAVLVPGLTPLAVSSTTEETPSKDLGMSMMTDH